MSDWQPDAELAAETKNGRVSLRLSVADDASSLSDGIEPDTFRHFMLLQPRTADPSNVRAYLAKLGEAPDIWPYTVRLNEQVLGMTCASHVVPAARQFGIGFTWYFREARGTVVNPAAKWLLLSDAFERLGAVRVHLQCDAENEVSAAAIRKLGAQHEGTLRHSGFQRDGTMRDTMVFSILASEWPAVEAQLRTRMQSKMH